LYGWHTTLLTALIVFSLVTSAAPPTPGMAAPLGNALTAPAGPGRAIARVEPLMAGLRPLVGGLPLGPALQVAGGDGAEMGASVPLQTTTVDQATLETQQPEVQWSPAGTASWQSVPTRQDIHAGDRVRTGPGASARLVYFEGTVTDIGPQTGVLVQRLERSPNGNIIGNLYQAVGTTVSRVVQLVDPAASFQIETPAATAFVRGTMPRLTVGADGVTQVDNVPDNTSGTVSVQGKDPDATIVSLAPGEGTRIAPGQPPALPAAISFGLGSAPVGQTVEQGAGQTERQQQRQQQQAQAQQAVAQAQVGLAAAAAELARLTQQEAALVQQVAQVASGNDRQRIASTLQPDGGAACATTAGQTCAVGGGLAGSVGTAGPASAQLSMQWRIQMPAARIPAGTVATVFLSTTRGIEFFDCPPASGGGQLACTGATQSVGRQGGTVRVFVNNEQVATGQIAGASPTAVATPTTTAVATPITTGVATPTATATPLPSGPFGIFTTTTGSAPNRQFVMEWRVFHFADPSNTANFEIQLEESMNNVYFVYRTSTDAGASATAGLQRGTGATALQLAFHQPTLTNGRAVRFTPTGVSTPIPAGTAAPCPGPDAFGYTCVDVSQAFVAGSADVGNHCDDCNTNVALPFPFTFYGQTYTQVNVSSNGNVQFVSNNTAFTETPLPNPGFDQTIFGFWDDWETSTILADPVQQRARDCAPLPVPKCGPLPSP
jgi:hypothetical protein